MHPGSQILTGSLSSILITGATSGIGAALARHYAAPGITLFLCGRDPVRLNTVAQDCRARGSEVHHMLLDVCDAPATEQWIRESDARKPLDLVIANAGVSGGPGIHGEQSAQTRHIFDVNVNGVLNTVLPAVQIMQPRRHGQIGIMSSMAGLRGIPSAPAYSASKNAVRAYGEALRGALSADNIRVSVICPGYVRTPMTDSNRFFMPFMRSAEQAAQKIARGLARNRPRIAFPRRMYALVWLSSVLPLRLTDPIFSRLPKKT